MGLALLGAIVGAIFGSVATFLLQKYFTRDAAAEVARLGGEFAAFKKEVERRERDRMAAEHVRVYARLEHGVLGNYTVYLKNESDEAISIETVHLVCKGVDLSRPMKPPSQDGNLNLPAGQEMIVSWAPRPDPFETLSHLDPLIAVQRSVPVPVELVLTCRVRERIVPMSIARLVTVHYSARRMTDFGP
jgi:hypothetical protein